eukprot:CAMPEP_0175079838 /NCGR_PEP_ID=MMETSP0052_2-20121109/25091_1 /TAXON_ID=51329 ORGANISM="Polytomella parva, Strain SAG 63-3" /NCGR_SAMPLE_ID=MMETSP0052_2 /ASSEMBLY_ACC=CAM_ASM_000194 /LENGTH=64 /DNA_ID=CAMNT_0016350305 /DNA_START=240 /DNA_END=434 /DNA_ORIENTATION=-
MSKVRNTFDAVKGLYVSPTATLAQRTELVQKLRQQLEAMGREKAPYNFLFTVTVSPTEGVSNSE